MLSLLPAKLMTVTTLTFYNFFCFKIFYASELQFVQIMKTFQKIEFPYISEQLGGSKLLVVFSHVFYFGFFFAVFRVFIQVINSEVIQSMQSCKKCQVMLNHGGLGKHEILL